MKQQCSMMKDCRAARTVLLLSCLDPVRWLHKSFIMMFNTGEVGVAIQTEKRTLDSRPSRGFMWCGEQSSSLSVRWCSQVKPTPSDKLRNNIMTAGLTSLFCVYSFPQTVDYIVYRKITNMLFVYILELLGNAVKQLGKVKEKMCCCLAPSHCPYLVHEAFLPNFWQIFCLLQ